eukprot:357899-Chlamydomonas_euryale.AAC.2
MGTIGLANTTSAKRCSVLLRVTRTQPDATSTEHTSGAGGEACCDPATAPAARVARGSGSKQGEGMRTRESAAPAAAAPPPPASVKAPASSATCTHPSAISASAAAGTTAAPHTTCCRSDACAVPSTEHSKRSCGPASAALGPRCSGRGGKRAGSKRPTKGSLGICGHRRCLTSRMNGRCRAAGAAPSIAAASSCWLLEAGVESEHTTKACALVPWNANALTPTIAMPDLPPLSPPLPWLGVVAMACGCRGAATARLSACWSSAAVA